MKDFFKPDIPDTAVYHVGISGGKDSAAALLWMVHESGIPRHRINATFCDTGHEHQHTYDQVEKLAKVHPIEVLKPELAFAELVQKKGRFPSVKARFCTEHLKIRPTQDHVRYLQQAYSHVVAVSGVRANESAERAKYLEYDYSGDLLVLQWRPLIAWTLDDVLAIHQRYGIPMNPLYALGARRVGCWPCVLCTKQEVRLVALHAPERIERIRGMERDVSARGKPGTFFAYDKVPKRFRSLEIKTQAGELMKVATIDDVVRWSMTGKRAQGHYMDEEPEPVNCRSGFCE